MPDLMLFIMTTRNMHVERHRRWRILFGVTELRNGHSKEQVMLATQHAPVITQNFMREDLLLCYESRFCAFYKLNPCV